MGKSRRARSGAANRKDPLSKPVKPPSDPELAALREQKILPIVKDLQSADPKQRSSASSAIANIIQDTKCRKLLLREQIVHIILTQTLTDSALESRAAGWGILQVLAQEEEADFCVHLYRQDILTAMEFAAKMVSDKFSSQNPAFKDLPKAETAIILSIAASIISLATALVEAQEDILEAVCANASITSLLFNIAKYTSESDDGITELKSDALACLMVMSEENTKLAQSIIAKDQALYETLQASRKDLSGDGILACGILHNIFVALQGQTVDYQILDDSGIIPTLSKTIATISPGQSVSNGSGWSNPFEYQQLALEILASIGTSLNSTAEATTAGDKPGPEEPKEEQEEEDEDMGEAGDEDADEPVAGEEEEDGGDDDDDEMDDDELQADMGMVTGFDDEDEDSGDINDLPVLKSLISQAIPALNRVAVLQASDPETMHLQGLALSALSNISWSVSLIDFRDEHNKSIQKAWNPVGQAVWTKVISPILAGDTADVMLATQVTSLAWAISRTLNSETPLAANEHRKFISLYQATRGDEATQNTEDPFQSLGVKCIGVLGQLALDPAPVTLNREVGTFLLTLLSGLPETPAADAVEALNQIFDVYGDEDAACDKEVFWKDNFLKHLEDTLPKLKAAVKGVDKRERPELRTRADEVVMNLDRFLGYKRKNKPT